jgi:hypothetical protein
MYGHGRRCRVTKVFIVTSGEYSDYGMNAVFSTEEAAQRFIDVHTTSRWDRYQIEDWELDENTPPDESLYRAAVNTFTGDVSLSLPSDQEQAVSEDSIQIDTASTFGGSAVYYVTWITTKDAESAQKISGERYAQVMTGQIPVPLWIRKGRWGAPFEYQWMVIPKKTHTGTLLQAVEGGQDIEATDKLDWITALQRTDAPLTTLFGKTFRTED